MSWLIRPFKPPFYEESRSRSLTLVIWLSRFPFRRPIWRIHPCTSASTLNCPSVNLSGDVLLCRGLSFHQITDHHNQPAYGGSLTLSSYRLYQRDNSIVLVSRHLEGFISPSLGLIVIARTKNWSEQLSPYLCLHSPSLTLDYGPAFDINPPIFSCHF